MVSIVCHNLNLKGYAVFYPISLFLSSFFIVLDIMGCSSGFCHVFTWFTTSRWSGRWLSASDMDVFWSDIVILCKISEVEELWSLSLDWVIRVCKLKTPAWLLEWRSLSPSPIESRHTWWRWYCSVFCSLNLWAWMSSTVLDLSTCWGRMSSKWLRKAPTRAT